MMSKPKSLAVTFLMVLSIFISLVGTPDVAPGVEGLTLDSFSDGQTDVNMSFGPGGGGNDSMELTVPAGSQVIEARMNLSGMPYTQGGIDYPENIGMDFDGDGSNDWEWDGATAGRLGYQKAFSNGNSWTSFEFGEGGGKNLSRSLRLPTGAKIGSASFDIKSSDPEGFNEFEFTGYQWDYMGYFITNAGDLNNDSFPDMVAMAPHRWVSWSDAHAYVFLGNETLEDEADVDIIHSAVEDDFFGCWADGGEDVNGDGYDDLVIGAKWSTVDGDWHTGKAYIYYGGDPMDTTPDVVLPGLDYYDHFGYSVAMVGDVNNDSYADVLVGAPYNESPAYYAGSAHLYFGGPDMDNVSDMNFSGSVDYGHLGVLVSSAGDVNGDGHPDFFIGASGDDTGGGDGAAYVHFGGPGLDNVSDVDIKPLGTNYFAEFGSGVGDLNGDGYDDIALNNDYNELWVYHGGDAMDNLRDLRFTGERAGDNFGIGVDTAGDLNNDGYDEMIVGAWNTGTDGNGTAYLYMGGSSMDTDADHTWVCDKDYYELGGSVAAAGDFNGDGFNDVHIGVAGSNTSATRAGSVLLEMYYKGMRTPAVGIEETGHGIWNHSDYFTGQDGTGDISVLLESAMNGVGTTHTDDYGTAFTDLTLNVTSDSWGRLMVKNISIEYDLTLTLPDFSDELNHYMDINEPEADGNYHIPIHVVTTERGGFRFNGLQVTVNQAPSVEDVGEYSLPEGSYNETLIDLFDVFSDDFDTDDNLTFDVKTYTEQDHVDVFLAGDRYLSVDAVTNSTDVNWTGTTEIRVGASDSGGLKSAVAVLMVNVTNVEDPPIITSTPPLEAMEGEAYSYDVNAIDGDPEDVHTYGLDQAPGNMTIDPGTGLIEWVPGLDDVGRVQVVVNVSDGQISDLQEFEISVTLRVTPGNTLPIISSEPVTEATVGVEYVYKVEAVDDDWDLLGFGLTEAPENMSIEKTTGRVSWLPNPEDVGSHKVAINVSDGKDRVFQRYVIIVDQENMNHLPVIEGAPSEEAYVGVDYNHKFDYSDQDDDEGVFSLVSGPFGMTLSGKGDLSWRPVPGDVGQHDFTVMLSDGKGHTTMTYSVDVLLNHAPSFSSDPKISAKVGEEYRYSITVTDIDAGDELVVDLIEFPYGMELNLSSLEIVWTPTDVQEGDNRISLKVTDGMSSNYQNFTINVEPETKKDDGGEGNEIGLFPWVLLAIVVVVIVVLITRALTGAKKVREGDSIIEDVFLIYKDGRLVSHHTRRLKPETDEHTLTAMLTAIQDFVRESIPTEGEKQKPIEQISFGDDKILLTHGKDVYIAAVVTGAESEAFRDRMKETVQGIENQFSDILTDWDGDMRALSGAKLMMKELLHEEGAVEDDGTPGDDDYSSIDQEDDLDAVLDDVDTDEERESEVSDVHDAKEGANTEEE